MKKLKFVHAADIHLDSPLVGLGQYDGAPTDQLRGATRQALENLVAVCIEEQADFLLIAGDLFDGDWRDFNTGLFFARLMGQLNQAGIAVFVVRGNHDAENVISRQLTFPDNVHIFPADKPSTVRLEDLGVAIHGQSFPTKAVQDDLSADYPPRVPGALNIGLLHTCAEGRPGHADYAPCTTEALANKGYAYWALGHVHTREVLHRDPWIVFPGCTQGRHVNETGPKGCTVVEAEDGEIRAVTHRDLDVVRWARCQVDVSAATSADDVIEAVWQAVRQELANAGDRLLAVRLEVTGRSQAHGELLGRPDHWAAQVRSRAVAEFPDQVWVEEVRFKTESPHDVDALRRRPDPLGQLLTKIQTLREDPKARHDLAAELTEMMSKLPPEAMNGPGAVNLSSLDVLGDLVDDVEQLLLAQLTSTEDLS